MQWNKGFIHIPQYEYTSTNQYGDRYKRIGTKKVSTAKLSSPINSPERVENMRLLILLSDQLDVPVRYDFDADPQVAFIEVIGKETL